MSPSRSAKALRTPAPDLLARAAALARAGKLPEALAAYEVALQWSPDDPEILAALAVLAGKIEMFDVAARLWEQVCLHDPHRLEAIEGRARALCELGSFDQAIFVLREALLIHPQASRLWNGLGVALMQDSQAGLAMPFFDEAIRLDRRFAAAVYNRGNARFDLGDLEGAAEDFERARKLARKPLQIATIEFAAATLNLAKGDLAEGWDTYESRLLRNAASAITFDMTGRRWAPGDPLAGKHLLVVGEQGLGDEVMFANLAPDLLAAVGAEGRLTLAVDSRLVDLFRRSFPGVGVTAHATDRGRSKLRRAVPDLIGDRTVDLWTPMGSLPRQFRRTHDDFPSTKSYLRPDPERVAHWRAWLGDGPPAVGISWRSGKMLGDRRRQYPPLALWTPLLASPGVRFVNIQYGDCAEELAAFRTQSAGQIIEPPDLDLRDDVDGLAALCAALDLVVCVANATGALAGACGARVAILSAPHAWPRLGREDFPWYPSARAFCAPAFGAWEPAMAQAAALVSELPH